MIPEPDNQLRLEIGHVLFIDIVGYSKLLIEEQKERLDQLTKIVLATAQVRDSTDEQLVRLPTGDGMALVFRHSAEEPTRCALEIAEALRKHPEIPVRMGIHSGPVSEVTDVSGRTNIAGAGINMAQRVMDCGDAGHILLSRRVAEDLEQYRQWQPRLHDLGECEVKHGVRLHVFNLYTEELGNPAPPARFAERKQREESGPSKSRSLWIALLVLLFLICFGVPALIFTPAILHSRSKAKTNSPLHESATTAVPEKSIAVLPFVNMSADKSDEYLSDGMTEELLNVLAKVKRIARAGPQLLLRLQGQERGGHLPQGRRATARQHGAGRQRAQSRRQAAHHRPAHQRGRRLSSLVGNLRPGHEGHPRRPKRSGASEWSRRCKCSSGSTRRALWRRRRPRTRKPTASICWAATISPKSHRRAGPTPSAYFEQALQLDPGFALAYCGLADVTAGWEGD